jgi:haloacetate dehalogenase
MIIRRATCRANGIRQFYLEAGAGPPVVLLHGFPETSFAWRFQIPALAPHYRVIAPDLRGYGETDKPSKGYDKRTIAHDIVELLNSLGVGRVALVGHDRGARVATRLAKNHPSVVDRLVVMDNVPTRIVAREMNAKVAREYWFFMFHLVPDLPEALIAGREDIWLRHFFSNWCYDPMTISGEAFETYVKAYSAPGAVRGAMSDYRATAEGVAGPRRCRAEDQLPRAFALGCGFRRRRQPVRHEDDLERDGRKSLSGADRALRPSSAGRTAGSCQRAASRFPQRLERVIAQNG